MSNYTKSTNFTAKDTLPSGDSQKIIRGSEFDTEFSAIATAVNSKADKSGDTVVLTAGTVSEPSLATVGDTNTGIYFPTADTMSFVTGGSERARFNSSGNLLVGTSSGSGAKLEVEPNSGSTHALALKMTTGANPLLTFEDPLGSCGISGNGGTLQFRAGGTNSAAIKVYILGSGNVGIGGASPAEKLSVVSGNIRLTDTYKVNWGGANSYIEGSNAGGYVALGTGATERARITSDGSFLIGTANTSTLGTNTKLKTGPTTSFGGITAGVTTAVDTGISINQGTCGGCIVLIASRNTSTGLATEAAVYIVRFYYDGNNAPTTVYVGGSSNFVTFGTSASNTLTVTNASGGNANYSWFGNK